MIGAILCIARNIQRTKIQLTVRVFWLLWRVSLATGVIVVFVSPPLIAAESDDLQVHTRISDNSPKKHRGRQLMLPETIPVCTAPGEQRNPKAVSDGVGGTVVFWIDLLETGWSLSAQHINASGEISWQTDGVMICEETGHERETQIVWSDDKAVVLWSNDQFHYRAQAINRAGEILWEKGGILLHVPKRTLMTILADGQGGIAILWSDTEERQQHYYLQRLDAIGNHIFPVDGHLLFSENELAFSGSAFISDGTNGFYAVWSELINNGRQIKALRFNSDGKQLWKSPTMVASLKTTQIYPDAVGDGDGGLVVVWQHYFAQKFYFDNIYAQRVDSTGSVRWGEYGVAICAGPGLEKSVWLADDGQGGVVAVWEDERDIYPDVYSQRISGAGKALWGANGTPVCTSEGHQIRPLLINSGRDRFFVVWNDYREDYGMERKNSVYGQKLNLAGKGLWTKDGVRLRIQQRDGHTWSPIGVGHPSGEVDLLWSSSGNIYLHRLK